jgi:hypothetical protein
LLSDRPGYLKIHFCNHFQEFMLPILLPNNHPDIQVRYNQLETAIKLVYSSIFTEAAQSYFDAIHYKIEEEKMAVVIQEVVGQNYNNRYYPTISGVAQSYNYYPIAYMQPEDGFSVAAVGLGTYVVGGENSFRFCPRYPTINPTDMHDMIRDSQKMFMPLIYQILRLIWYQVGKILL